MATLTIADLDNGKRDLQTVDEVANSPQDFTTTRYGDNVLTLAGALRRLGYQPPVEYASGLTVASALFTVEKDGVIYAPLPSLMPFTTGAWDAAQWRVIQGDVGLRQDLASDLGAGFVGFKKNFVGAAFQTVASHLSLEVWVEDFGADNTGAEDSTPAFNYAISAVRASGGGRVRIGPGTFKLEGVEGEDGITHGFHVPFSSANGANARVSIQGSGKSTVLKAGSDNMIIVRYSDSHGGVSSVTYDAAGRPGVWPLLVGPGSVTQTTSLEFQMFNTFSDFYMIGGDEGIVMQCGPRVAGADSGCWYNNFRGYHIFSSKRAIWLRAPANAASGVNANRFFGGRQGQGMNTGLQIDAGSGNQFYGCHNEGINTGSSPNATPTAVKIAASDVWGSSNDNNQFFGTRNEDCTRQLDNQNTRTVLLGGDWRAALFAGVKPAVMVGADPSVMPLVLPGVEYSEGVPGYASGYFGFNAEPADTGYSWQDWPISLANSRISGATSVSSISSKFKRQGRMVDWVFVIKFTATGANQRIEVAPPRAPNTALYTSVAMENPWYTLSVEDGTGIKKQVACGWLNATNRLYIKAPASGWNTGGDNNGVFVSIRYHD